MKWLEAQAPPPRGEGDAKVAASFEEGSVVLADEGEITLAWGPGRPAEASAKAGTYRVRATRIVRGSFLISSSGKPEPSLVVKDGTELKVDETVRFECRAKRKGKRLELGFVIKGTGGRGLSVYKDGKRVPVTYKVLGKDGAVLAEGTMTYGWGGGGWASVEPEGEAEKVEYAVETGPFQLDGETAVHVR